MPLEAYSSGRAHDNASGCARPGRRKRDSPRDHEVRTRGRPLRSELMLEVFHEDAIDDHGSFRLPAPEAVDRIVEAIRRSQVSQHHMTNILLDVIDADTVHVETYATCFLVEAADSGEQLRSMGLRNRSNGAP